MRIYLEVDFSSNILSCKAWSGVQFVYSVPLARARQQEDQDEGPRTGLSCDPDPGQGGRDGPGSRQ